MTTMTAKERSELEYSGRARDLACQLVNKVRLAWSSITSSCQFCPLEHARAQLEAAQATMAELRGELGTLAARRE